jgi:hypothetical protein
MSVKQIVQIAKDKPNTVRAATVPGSMWDYILDQVEANSGAKFLRVPFQGGGPASTRWPAVTSTSRRGSSPNSAVWRTPARSLPLASRPRSD